MVLNWLIGDRRPNLTDASIMALVTLEEQRHLERIKRRWEIYRGDHPPALKVRTLADGTSGPNDNVIINYARDIVDTGVSFLFGEAPEFTLDEGEKSERETWLDAAWEANGGVTLLQKDALNGAICGHSFVRLYAPDPARYGHEYPRLVVLDPATVWPTWDDEDIDVVTRYRIQWTTTDPVTRRPIVRRQLIEMDGGRWWITDQRTQSNSNTWETISSVEWAFPWCPVFQCQNLPIANEFWGISDLEDDMLTGQHALNFLASNMQRIIRNHAHPKTWGSGVSNRDDVDMSPDKVSWLPKEATLQNLEMQGDLASSLAYLKWFAQSLVTTNRVPEIALGISDEPGNLSGVALQIKFWPLLAKTEQKRRLREGYLQRISMGMLDAGNKGRDMRPGVSWPEILPNDTKTEREAAVMDHELGASAETILTRFGYDWETEQARRKAENEASMDVGQALLDEFTRGGRPNEERRTDEQGKRPQDNDSRS